MKKLIALLLVISSLTLLSSCSIYFASTEGPGSIGSGAYGENGKLIVPDFVGKNADEVLRDKSLVMFGFSIEHDYSSEYEYGIIFEQSPAPGTEIDSMDAVSITVSKGPRTEHVPVLRFRELDEARSELEDLGFKVTVKYEVDEQTEKGLVIRTEPEERTELPEGSEVTLYVSK
ncbi:MAG: PASTA domain-containing protein [Clostridia bacterium]|nr:PASTA domain-containing protein [Clostridia bacterium]